jgi:hypothetical protein
MMKKVTLPSLVALFALRIAAVDAATLVSYYQFEDNPAGTTVANSVASAPDGTLFNGPMFIPTGPTGLGQALDFDGVNDVVGTTPGGFPNSAALGRGSISFWVRTTDADQFAFTGTFNLTTGTNASQQAFQFLGNSDGGTNLLGRLSGYVRPHEGVDYDLGWIVHDPTVDWRDDDWHHILHTWQNEPGGNFGYSVFIDGQEQTTVVTNGNLTPSSSGTFSYVAWDKGVVLGRRNLSTTNDLNADISLDDYGVYFGQLTDGEAAAVYNLAVEPDLLYDLGEADLLFNEFNDPNGGVTIGALTWTVFSGLSGIPGQVIKNGEGDFTLFLTETAGLNNGIFPLESVPEPATIALVLVGLGIGVAGCRRRPK